MNKYILIGIPHCGKTTLGRQVAEILNMDFFDTDLLTVEKMGMQSPLDFFRNALNGQFLYGQLKVMIELAELNKPALIATGAEVALMPECAKLMKTMGTVIHVQRKPDVVIAGLKNDGKNRLVLVEQESGTVIDTQEKSVELYSQELEQYKALADVMLENDGSEEEGVKNLVSLINSLTSKG